MAKLKGATFLTPWAVNRTFFLIGLTFAFAVPVITLNKIPKAISDFLMIKSFKGLVITICFYFLR